MRVSFLMLLLGYENGNAWVEDASKSRRVIIDLPQRRETNLKNMARAWLIEKEAVYKQSLSHNADREV